MGPEKKMRKTRSAAKVFEAWVGEASVFWLWDLPCAGKALHPKNPVGAFHSDEAGRTLSVAREVKMEIADKKVQPTNGGPEHRSLSNEKFSRWWTPQRMW